MRDYRRIRRHLLVMAFILFGIAVLGVALAIDFMGCSPHPTIYRTESAGNVGTATTVQGHDGVVTTAHGVDGDVELQALDGERERVSADKVRRGDDDIAHIMVDVTDGNEYPLCNHAPEDGEQVTIYRWSGPAYWDSGPFVVYESRTVKASNGKHILLDGTIPNGASGAPAISEHGCIIGIVTSVTPGGGTRLLRASVLTEFLEE